MNCQCRRGNAFNFCGYNLKMFKKKQMLSFKSEFQPDVFSTLHSFDGICTENLHMTIIENRFKIYKNLAVENTLKLFKRCIKS